MRAGQLRHPIIIQQVTETNTGGNITNVWSQYAAVRAAVEPVSAAEFWAAQQVQDSEVVVFRIRHLPGVKQKMRVLYDYKAYDIKGAPDVKGRGREMLLRTVVSPQEYATFSYGAITVAAGDNDGDVIVSWTTDFYSSSKVKIRVHESAPKDFGEKTETDTDPRVLSHDFLITGLHADTLYEIRAWGENEAGWSAGWSGSYYFSVGSNYSIPEQGDDPLI